MIYGLIKEDGNDGSYAFSAHLYLEITRRQRSALTQLTFEIDQHKIPLNTHIHIYFAGMYEYENLVPYFNITSLLTFSVQNLGLKKAMGRLSIPLMAVGVLLFALAYCATPSLAEDSIGSMIRLLVVTSFLHLPPFLTPFLTVSHLHSMSCHSYSIVFL